MFVLPTRRGAVARTVLVVVAVVVGYHASLGNSAEVGVEVPVTSITPNLQGFFLDAHHHVPGSWKGVRMISDASLDDSSTSVEQVILLGSDDGDAFWKLTGRRIDDKLYVDFSPKGGPVDVEATWALAESGMVITFGDGNTSSNTWARVDARYAPDGPDFGPLLFEEPLVGSLAVQGFFRDPAHYVEGTLAGMRMISDASQEDSSQIDPASVTILGSDDGFTIWICSGTFLTPEDRATGKMLLDFSAKGGPKDLDATWDAVLGRIVFADGNFWPRVAQQGWRDA